MSYPWLQQKSIKEKIKLEKVLGPENPADMDTKGFNGDQSDCFIRMLDMEHRDGRSDLAPQVHELMKNQECEA